MDLLNLASASSDASAALDALAASSWSIAEQLGPFKGKIWKTYKIFEGDRWKDVLFWVRMVLCSVTALLLILEARATKLREYVAERTKIAVAVTLTVISFFVYFDLGNPNTRYSEYYHRHEFFHYFLGAKYFNEIGYKRLYECVSIAEVELDVAAAEQRLAKGGRTPEQIAPLLTAEREKIEQKWSSHEIRDLNDNLVKPIRKTNVLSNPAYCKSHFSDSQWVRFRDDVEWMKKVSYGSYWDNMKRDHGYNPPPVWTMVGRPLAELGKANDTTFKRLAAIDLLFHVGAVVFLFWGFGWRVATVATVWWGCNAPANFYWTGGAFLRQDWFFLLVAALALAKRRQYALSGAALMWSGLIRIFPLILFFGWGCMVLYHLVRYRRFHRSHVQLMAGAAITMGVLVPTSAYYVGGWQPWKDFVSHTIGHHSRTPLTNHMGWESIMVHTWKGRVRFTKDDNLEDAFAGWKQGRLDRKKAWDGAFWGVNLFIAAWIAWALRRSKHLWIGIPMSLPLVMGMTNLTCYYYSMYIAVGALILTRPQLGPPYLMLSAGSQVLLQRYFHTDDRFVAISYLFFLFGFMMLWSYSRPLTLERVRNWLAGRPDVGPVRRPLVPSTLAADVATGAEPEPEAEREPPEPAPERKAAGAEPEGKSSDPDEKSAEPEEPSGEPAPSKA